MTKVSLTISYDDEEDPVDYRMLATRLSNLKGSTYEKRSINFILKAILAEHLPALLEDEEKKFK